MIHVIFNSSAAGFLRRVLSSRGVCDKVIELADPLDWGPISSGVSERLSWLDSNAPLSSGSWDWLREREDWFRNAVAVDQERLVWLSSASAREQAGLYWFLDNFGDAGAQFAVVEKGSGIVEAPVSIGELDEADMAALFDRCPRVGLDPSRFPTDTWRMLTAENGLLRVVKHGHLESAPENFFDDYLVQHCSHRWTDWTRVVGEAMMSMSEARHRTSLYFTDWRLRELVRRGHLECSGELPPIDDTRESMVRLAS